MLVFDEVRLETLQESLFTPTAPLPGPPALFHYTSLDTLMRFVETKRMFVTDVRFMNDASELEHAASVVNWVSKKSLLPREWGASLVSMMTNMSLDAVCYVGCFSEKASRLSQWRGYCRTGNGVSVGFAVDMLTNNALGQGFSLGKCEYNKHRQRKIATELLKCVRSTSADETSPRAVSSVLRIASLLKNPAFEEEREWRIVSTDAITLPDSEVFYRAGRHMLIPYQLFELPTSTVNPLREHSLLVEHIVVGPTANERLSVHSLQRYLSKHGVWNPQSSRFVKGSGIPLRDM